MQAHTTAVAAMHSWGILNFNRNALSEIRVEFHEELFDSYAQKITIHPPTFYMDYTNVELLMLNILDLKIDPTTVLVNTDKVRKAYDKLKPHFNITGTITGRFKNV